jgi:hypothetical protein
MSLKSEEVPAITRTPLQNAKTRLDHGEIAVANQKDQIKTRPAKGRSSWSHAVGNKRLPDGKRKYTHIGVLIALEIQWPLYFAETGYVHFKIKTLAAAVGVGQRVTKHWVSMLIKDGFLRRIRQGVYRLTEPYTAAAEQHPRIEPELAPLAAPPPAKKQPKPCQPREEEREEGVAYDVLYDQNGKAHYRKCELEELPF